MQTDATTNFFGSSRESSVHSEEDLVVSQQSDELLHTKGPDSKTVYGHIYHF